MFLVPLIFIGVLVLYFIGTYNKFITVKRRIVASIQEIGNQLKRQADLIPNLVESVKGYMVHEQTALDKITEARKMVMESVGSGNAQKMIDAGDKLQQAIAPLRAVFESTPQLQAAGPTSKLMDELRDTADKVMYSRRTLIDLVADYNTMILTIPTNLVASLFGFKEEAGLKVPEMEGATTVGIEDLKTPEIKLN